MGVRALSGARVSQLPSPAEVLDGPRSVAREPFAENPSPLAATHVAPARGGTTMSSPSPPSSFPFGPQLDTVVSSASHRMKYG